MTSLTIKSKATITVSASQSRDSGSIGWNPADLGATKDFTFGNAADQCNELFDDDRTLAGGATETLDLSGVLANWIGDSVTFTRIKVLYIKNNDAAQTLTVGGAAANGWVGPFGAATETITIRPGGFILLVAPDATAWAVTAGTADQLKIAAAAGDDVSYRIVLAGTKD